MKRVVLLHGLWMRSLVMWPLATHLREEGFEVEVVDYASILRGPMPCIAWLSRRLRSAREADTHLVGHSLGGVVAVHAALEAGERFRGRVLCLGSPLAGSAIARRMSQRRGVAALAGRSAGILARGIDRLPPGREIGVIAGRRALGNGRLLHRFDEPNDGSVAVSETRVAGLRDHIEVGVSHTGLVYSHEVARLGAEFLREGRFLRPDERAESA